MFCYRIIHKGEDKEMTKIDSTRQTNSIFRFKKILESRNGVNSQTKPKDLVNVAKEPLPNLDICMFVDPDSRSRILRFAIYNKDKSKVKFLKSGKIFDAEELEDNRRFDPSIGYKVLSCPTNWFYDFVPIINITEFNEHDEEDLVSRDYSLEEIMYIKKIMNPFIRIKGQEFSIERWLNLENKFVGYQKSILKECEVSCNPKSKELYNF